MDPSKYEPGSREAVARGCTCSPTLNRHGEGTFHGQPRFYYDRKCPIHRMEVDTAAAESGTEARAGRRARQHDKDERTRR
jgi:hypothetical protein